MPQKSQSRAIRLYSYRFLYDLFDTDIVFCNFFLTSFEGIMGLRLSEWPKAAHLSKIDTWEKSFLHIHFIQPINATVPLFLQNHNSWCYLGHPRGRIGFKIVENCLFSWNWPQTCKFLAQMHFLDQKLDDRITVLEKY